MKKLNDYIVEQEINESRFGDILKRLFKSSGPAMKTYIKNKFANAYPNWYKEYEKLEKITDVEEAKKTIEELLAAVDDMTIFKDDNERDVSKITTLSLQKINAEKTKNEELIKWIDSKIEEISNTNPKAQKQFEDALKQSEKGKGGKGGESNEGGEENVNPGVNAGVQNPKDVKSIQNMLDLKDDDLSRVIGKMENFFNVNHTSTNESLSIFESNKADQNRRKIIRTLYNNPKTEKEMNFALTTLFLAYEKIKGCAKSSGSTVNPQIMQALINGYENAKEKTKDEVKNDIDKAKTEQK